VADDEEVIRELLEYMLSRNGASVETAGSCAEARERLAACRYDCAVLDYDLGDGTGLEILRLLRDGAPQTRALILTGVDRDEILLSEAAALGAEAVLAKATDMNRIPDQIFSEPAAT
jgi:two-component system response regulator PilR (NtrC family)